MWKPISSLVLVDFWLSCVKMAVYALKPYPCDGKQHWARIQTRQLLGLYEWDFHQKIQTDPFVQQTQTRSMWRGQAKWRRFESNSSCLYMFKISLIRSKIRLEFNCGHGNWKTLSNYIILGEDKYMRLISVSHISGHDWKHEFTSSISTFKNRLSQLTQRPEATRRRFSWETWFFWVRQLAHTEQPDGLRSEASFWVHTLTTPRTTLPRDPVRSHRATSPVHSPKLPL